MTVSPSSDTLVRYKLNHKRNPFQSNIVVVLPFDPALGIIFCGGISSRLIIYNPPGSIRNVAEHRFKVRDLDHLWLPLVWMTNIVHRIVDERTD
jgi:hypothetical protein